jgi:hypothetical protein
MHLKFSGLNKYQNIKRENELLHMTVVRSASIILMAHKSIHLVNAWLREWMDLKALYRLCPLWLYKLQFQQPQFNPGKN